MSNDEYPLGEVVDNAWGMLWYVGRATGVYPVALCMFREVSRRSLGCACEFCLPAHVYTDLPNSKNSPSRFTLVRLINPRTQKPHDTLSAA